MCTLEKKKERERKNELPKQVNNCDKLLNLSKPLRTK